MCMVYAYYEIGETVFTQFKNLSAIENARQFYLEEAIKSNWSTRQLERQINTF